MPGSKVSRAVQPRLHASRKYRYIRQFDTQCKIIVSSALPSPVSNSPTPKILEFTILLTASLGILGKRTPDPHNVLPPASRWPTCSVSRCPRPHIADSAANSRRCRGYATEVLRQLNDERDLHDLSRDELVERLTHYYAEINAVHPFREATGAHSAPSCVSSPGRWYRLTWKHLDSKRWSTLRSAAPRERTSRCEI